MNFATALTTFAVIVPAELPDKSMFASLVLSTRFRAIYVWTGIAAAFAVHVVIAVTAGGLLTLLPQRLLQAIVALLFFVGAAIMLFGHGKQSAEEGEELAEEAEKEAPLTPLRVMVSCFAVVFVGEWGDITQLATANLSARYDDPLSVGVGATAGLWFVAALAVVAGRSVLQLISVRLVSRIAGVLLAVLGVASAISALR